MAVFKCKMCGGDLEIQEGITVCECEYCCTKQTIPSLDNEKKLNLFNRANRLRLNSEFDKAANIYESIIAEFPEEAEGYWGLVLCNYGIEYVDDPATARKIPTCHRAAFESVANDENYQLALEYADVVSQKVYRDEAREIDRIMSEILSISKTEKPYDIFICYKETDAAGGRTIDSVIAQDVYDALTDKGYRVFFSRISLEDKIGKQYEPYIFAALNSAKVMLAFGTKYEYFQAVWVKNEWSRFLKLMAKDKSKNLVPCYKDMDAYDMPDEFKALQAQDMGKVGAIQDLVRGVEKLLSNKDTAPMKANVTVDNSSPQIEPLLKRAFMFLEDGDWKSADEYCEKVLDIDPECAEAYLGKLMVELGINKREALKNAENPFDNRNNYQKIIRYGSAELKEELEGYIEYIKDRNEKARLDSIYGQAKMLMGKGTETSFKRASELFASISGYLDSASLVQDCLENAEAARKDDIYAKATYQMKGNSIYEYENAVKLFESISGWRDADEQIIVCQQKIKELEIHREEERKEQERIAEEKRKEKEHIAEENRMHAAKEAKRRKKIIGIASCVVAVIIVFAIVLNTIIIPNGKYNDAIALMEQGKYREAILAFEAMDGYKDSNIQINECKYRTALYLMEEEKYQEAKTIFEILGDYKDSSDKIGACNEAQYKEAISFMEEGNYRQAISVFDSLDDYKDSQSYFTTILKDIAVKNTISAGYSHTVGLKSDGTVVAIGDNYFGPCDVDDWTDIAAIAAGDYHTVGLKSDGTVVAVGSNGYGQCDVEDWTDRVAISADSSHTVGLKSDGTVVAVGYNMYGQCNVEDWTDIIAISAGGDHTVGLKSDGTVVAIGYIYYGQCDVEYWTDIVAISAGEYHTVGLKSDGTVVAIGDNEDGQCDVEDWADIVAISAGGDHTVGLKSDGTVVAVGSNGSGQCDVDDWADIVAISAGDDHTVGLKSDGTVVFVGFNYHGQCDVEEWHNIMLPD